MAMIDWYFVFLEDIPVVVTIGCHTIKAAFSEGSFLMAKPEGLGWSLSSHHTLLTGSYCLQIVPHISPWIIMFPFRVLENYNRIWYCLSQLYANVIACSYLSRARSSHRSLWKNVLFSTPTFVGEPVLPLFNKFCSRLLSPILQSSSIFLLVHTCFLKCFAGSSFSDRYFACLFLLNAFLRDP